MLIKEIEPIKEIGLNLLKKDYGLELIDEIIELPLRMACKIFKEKGIETVMSSANRNNILVTGSKPIEKENVKGREFFYPHPTFQDAGRGYAWIMLNFDNLSDENKDLMFSLEERVDDNGEKIGEKMIWFVNPCTFGNLDYKLKIGEYTYEHLRTCLSDEIPQGIEYDARLAKFASRHIVLSYNNRYPVNTAIIRMPINEQTTVSEVDEYFSLIAKGFYNQNMNKNLEDKEHSKVYH